MNVVRWIFTECGCLVVLSEHDLTNPKREFFVSHEPAQQKFRCAVQHDKRQAGMLWVPVVVEAPSREQREPDSHYELFV